MKNIQEIPIFNRNLWFSFGLFCLLLISFASYIWSEKEIDEANDLRHNSLLLANELRQNSEDLTRMARIYAVTGNPIHKQYYFDILNIQAGKLPRPLDYHKPYWIIVLENGNPPRPNSNEIISLYDLIKKLDLTEQELELLSEIKTEAELVNKIELETIEFANPSFPNYAANQSKARSILHSENYFKAKATVLTSISNFYEKIDLRTQSLVWEYKNLALVFRMVLILIAAGLFFMLFRTIKELKNSKEEVIKNETYLKNIISILPDIIFLFDKDYRYLDVITNDFSKLLIPKEQIIGKTVYEALPPELAEKAADLINKTLESGTEQILEYSVDLPNEKEWFELRMLPINESETIAFARNITERIQHLTEIKKLEILAEEHKELFHKFFLSSTTAICLNDVSDGKFIETNQSFLNLLGYTKEEVIGNTSTELGFVVNRKSREDRVIQIKAGNSVPIFDLVFRKKTGEIGYAIGSVTVTERGGQALAFTHLVDVTIQKQTELALQKSQEQWSSFMNAATDNFSIYDENLNLVEINDISLSWLQGWTRETAIGKHVLELNPILKDTDRYKAYQRVVTTGEPYSTEINLARDANLGEKYLGLKAFKVGKGMGLILTDITDMKRLENSLRKEQSRLKHILDNLITGAVQIDSDGQIIYANFKACEILNVELDAITKKYFSSTEWKQIDEDGNPFPQGKLPLAIAMIEKRTVLNIEHGIIDHAGNRKWLIVNAFPLLDSDNNLQGAIANFIDITDRKIAEELLVQSEKSLKENENFLRKVTDSIPSIIGYWKKDFTCKFANNKYMFWFGKSKEEMQGIHMRDALGEQIYESNLPNALKALNGEKVQFERVIRKPNGEIGYALGNFMPDLDENTGEALGFIVLLTDVTELKETSIALDKAKQQADSANRAKSEFLASMSHEIRTPLNGVIGFSDLLRRTKLSDTQSQYMEIVFQSANSLMDLLNDILDFSKIEAGKLELASEKIDIFELIGQASDIIKYKAFEKNLEILLDIPPKLPRYIYSDPVRLRQILINLLGNAIKFTQEGEIEIKIENINSKETEDGSREAELLFSVRDTGIGISLKNQERIFEAFAQEDSSTTRKYGGTGLGLAISNKLLLLMDSKLELESEPTKGSRFYFTLKTKLEEGEKQIRSGFEEKKTYS